MISILGVRLFLQNERKSHRSTSGNQKFVLRRTTGLIKNHFQLKLKTPNINYQTTPVVINGMHLISDTGKHFQIKNY